MVLNPTVMPRQPQTTSDLPALNWCAVLLMLHRLATVQDVGTPCNLIHINKSSSHRFMVGMGSKIQLYSCHLKTGFNGFLPA